MNGRIRLAFYGDDFTGSTDALEVLSRAGAKAVLFIEPPTKETLAAYPGIDAFGVAGMTRSLSPAEMEAVLQEAFENIRSLRPRHVHYKVCSTFDSSPLTGSIGKAIDLGISVFGGSYVPVIVAAPALGRYLLFGHLFARMGTAAGGSIYRLDRHPSMRHHPVTPADESDLRLHLGRQTNKKIDLVDILTVRQSAEAVRAAVEKKCAEGAAVIFFDGLDADDLLTIGQCLDDPEHTPFSAGSSGVEMALGSYWNSTGVWKQPSSWPELQPAEPLLVLSGSCSPVSAAQIHTALKNGFHQVVLPAEKLTAGALQEQLQPFIQEALQKLKEGISVIVHTGGEKRSAAISASVLGTALGMTGRFLADAVPLPRIVVAGGDTSSYAARALGIVSVEMIASLVTGAPLCRATAPGSPVDGCEVNFKGGQVGSDDYFLQLAAGTMKRHQKIQ